MKKYNQRIHSPLRFIIRAQRAFFHIKRILHREPTFTANHHIIRRR